MLLYALVYLIYLCNVSDSAFFFSVFKIVVTFNEACINLLRGIKHANATLCLKNCDILIVHNLFDIGTCKPNKFDVFILDVKEQELPQNQEFKHKK